MANAAPIWGTGTWGDFLWKTWGGTATVATATAGSSTPTIRLSFAAGAATATADQTAPDFVATQIVVVAPSAGSASAAFGAATVVGSVTFGAYGSATADSLSASVVNVAKAVASAAAGAGAFGANDVVLVWNVQPSAAAAAGAVPNVTFIGTLVGAAGSATGAWSNVQGKFFTIVCLPFGAVAPQSLQRGYNATGWDTNYVNVVQDAPVPLSGWSNPRRSSIENSEMNEVFDSLERYLSGTIYADDFALNGFKVRFKWDAAVSRMELYVNDVYQGHLKYH